MTDTKTATIRAYFAHLTAGDIPGIIAMFTPEAHVISPFLGKMAARAFFEKLDAASSASNLTVFDILLGQDADTAAAHFRYEWTLKDGSEIEFSGIDYFIFAPSGKFQSMAIFYDTHPLRQQVGDKYS